MGELSANSVPTIFSVRNNVGARIGVGRKSLLSSGRVSFILSKGMLQRQQRVGARRGELAGASLAGCDITGKSWDWWHAYFVCVGFLLWSSSYLVSVSHKLTNKNMITENAPWQTLLRLQR